MKILPLMETTYSNSVESSKIIFHRGRYKKRLSTNFLTIKVILPTPLKILLLDDNLTRGKNLGDMLDIYDTLNHHFDYTHSPQTAIAQLRQQNIDVFLCKLVLPDTDAFAMLEQVQLLAPRTKIVILTNGHYCETIHAEALIRGASDTACINNTNEIIAWLHQEADNRLASNARITNDDLYPTGQAA